MRIDGSVGLIWGSGPPVMLLSSPGTRFAGKIVSISIRGELASVKSGNSPPTNPYPPIHRCRPPLSMP